MTESKLLRYFPFKSLSTLTQATRSPCLTTSPRGSTRRVSSNHVFLCFRNTSSCFFNHKVFPLTFTWSLRKIRLWLPIGEVETRTRTPREFRKHNGLDAKTSFSGQSKRRVTAEEEGQWPLRKGIRDDQTCGAGGNTGENDDRSRWPGRKRAPWTHGHSCLKEQWRKSVRLFQTSSLRCVYYPCLCFYAVEG